MRFLFTALRKLFLGTDTIILFTPRPLPFRQQYLMAPDPPQFPLENRLPTAVLPESLSAFGNENGPGRRAVIVFEVNGYWASPLRQVSMALAAEGTSAVGAATSMVSPFSSIALTMVLP